MVAYLKSVTDEDAEAQLRHQTLWFYIARDPTGMVYSSGRKRTRAECERVAIAHAAERAEEDWPESKQWPTRGLALCDLAAERKAGPLQIWR